MGILGTFKPANPSKAWAEQFFLAYSVVWILLFGTVVATKIYMQWSDLEYLILGFVLALPYVLIPLFFPAQIDRALPITERYWIKANAWVWIFSFVGNYFYTHYFYRVLGASYSFPVHIQLNEVPFFLYLITHAYFMFYFTISNIVIRLVRTGTIYRRIRTNSGRLVFNAVLIFVMAVITAFMETFTIQSVPYYSHQSKEFMYTVGSLFYAIYFFGAFPMFFEVDEKPGRAWTFSYTLINSFACSMIVLLVLDFARLGLIALNVNPVSGVSFL